MKYRVKFKCYWYNTGAADNHYYDRNEDFDTLEDATAFKVRVDTQFKNSKRRIVFDAANDKPSEYELKWNPPITIEEVNAWEESDNYVEVENGFIESEAKIFEYYPAKEIEIQ